MPKKLVVAAISGTIYDARLTKTPGVMNKDTPGFWQYQWPGVGTLTREDEKKEGGKDG